MSYLCRLLTIILISLTVWSCHTEAPVSPDPGGDQPAVLAKDNDDDEEVSRAEVTIFQAAGPAGARGVLTEGDTFPPTKRGESKLRREDDELSFEVRTSGLPPGAYTNWWVLINDPSQCAVPNACTLGDVFVTPASRPSAFWATGGIVKENGKGKFKAEIEEGEASKGPDGFLFGSGLEDAENAVVFIIIKYHGLASDDPDELFLQTNTLLGLCDDRANAFPPPNGQCFDPQIAVHHP